MDEKKIMDLITSEYSWEQIIYKVIAWEGMDPWDLDLSMLSATFIKYISKMEELDFKVPAKYIIISAILLRMKSDHLDFLDMVQQYSQEQGAELEGDGADELPEEEGIPAEENAEVGFEINPITVPPIRKYKRKVVVTELISALKKALRTENRREVRGRRHRGQINIKDDNITYRIDYLYDKINEIMSRLNQEEVSFQKLIENSDRKDIIETFIPLIHLDHQKKLECRQDKFFEDIFIRKR